MDVQVEKTGSYLRKLSVQIPVGTVNEAFDKALRKLGKQAQIPGFRPGKIPRSVIERYYKSQIAQEVQTQLLEDTLFRAMDDSAVSAVAMPRVSLGDLQRDAIFSYTAEVEVQPEITLQKWEGLQAPEVDSQVTDEAIQAELESMRRQAAQTVPVLVRDTVQQGDVVLLDYLGRMDGEPFAGGSGDSALVEVGGGGYIPGFAEGLVGAKVPSVIDVPVTFPADYNAAQLAGRDAVFTMTLKELKTREVPEADDEFAKDMGFDSLAVLQDDVRKRLQGKKDEEAAEARRLAILKALVEANPFEVPPSMLTAQSDRIINRTSERLTNLLGRSFELTAAQTAELRKDVAEEANFQLRSGLLLAELGRVLGIEISDKQLDQELERLAAENAEHEDALREHYETAENRESLRFNLIEQQVVERLMAQAVFAAPEAPETPAAPTPAV